MEAYPVPFRVERSPTRVRFVNTSDDAVFWVRAILDGPGIVLSPPTPKLDPERGFDVVLRGPDVAQSLLVVQWLRRDGRKYLYSVAL